MTVKDLIEILNKVEDKDLPVCISSDFCLYNVGIAEPLIYEDWQVIYDNLGNKAVKEIFYIA